MFGGGGFGGGNDGSMFAGGGFVASQQPENTGYGGGASGGRARGSNNQTLRTLTIRQIAKDIDERDGDTKIVDGAELSNVSIIGKILTAHESSMRVNLTVTDGTGELEVTHWIQDESEAAMASKRAELRPGVYVRAYGHVQSNNSGRRNFSAFAMRPITDFNEVTYHFLRCIFEHVHLTKGGAGAQQAAPNGAGMALGAAGVGNQWQQPAPMAMKGATAYGGGAGDAGSPCANAVLAIVRSCNSDAGMHTHEVYNRLTGQFNKQQVDQALQQLTSDAHVYTTTDDDHYKAA
eukprot:gene11728-11872_t